MTRPARIKAALVGTALATVLTTLGTGPAHADQRWKETAAQGTALTPTNGTNHCISPDGVDLNMLLSIREPIIGPVNCRVAFAKKPWVRTFPSWGTAASAATAVYPAGYTPSLPNPFDDFLLKFLGVRVTQDIGTPQEQSVSYGPEVLRLVTPVEGLPFGTFATPAIPGLRPGPHTSTVFFRMAFEHCDGAGTDQEENCLPAGEVQYTGDTPFEVVKKRM
ncbi:hypothetical protein [Streptomyces antibioticus]|uniref:hypothetical protein n=1 Tax=Streptomyces antibioticus TaxID=1890 RepID=UPI00340F0B58